MDSLVGSIDPQVVLIGGAIAISLLLLRLFLNILNVGWGTIVTIVAILFVMNYVFGISPRQLWFEMSHLPQDLARLAKTFT